MDSGTVGSDAISGAGMGAILGPWGAAAGALGGAVLGMFSPDRNAAGLNEATQQENDPLRVRQQLLENKLMSSKTGEDYATHQAAQHADRANQLYGQASRSFTGNAAVTSGMYDKIHGQEESENQGSNVEGANINEDNQKTAGERRSKHANFMCREFQYYQSRPSQPSLGEKIMGKAKSGFIGDAAG